MPNGLAILASSVVISVVHTMVIGGHTMVEIDAQMSSVRQRIQVHQVALRFFDLLTFESQLLFGECPELALSRLPIATSHD